MIWLAPAILIFPEVLFDHTIFDMAVNNRNSFGTNILF